MRGEKHIEVKVGLLVLVALVVLAGFIFVLGNFSLAKGFSFYVDFDFSGNLQAGAPVKIAGIKVGKVEQVDYLGGQKITESGRRVYVRVKAWVQERVRGTVFEDAEFFINTQGVLGEQYLEIVPGSPDKKPIQPHQILVGVTPPRMDLVVSRLYELLDGVTRLLREDRQTIHNLLQVSVKTLSSIDVLLNENQNEIKGLMGSLDNFVAQSGELIMALRQGIGHPQQLKSILNSLERTSVSVSRNIDDLLAHTNQALEGVSAISQSIGPPEKKRIRQALEQLVKLGDQVYVLTNEAKTLVTRINQGQGTAGALIAKEELYDDLKEMVRDLKRNPWKFLWRE